MRLYVHVSRNVRTVCPANRFSNVMPKSFVRFQVTSVSIPSSCFFQQPQIPIFHDVPYESCEPAGQKQTSGHFIRSVVRGVVVVEVHLTQYQKSNNNCEESRYLSIFILINELCLVIESPSYIPVAIVPSDHNSNRCDGDNS
jgi:hypothetical protein